MTRGQLRPSIRAVPRRSVQRFSSFCSASARFSGRPSSTTTSPSSNTKSGPGRLRARALAAHAGDLDQPGELELRERAADRARAAGQQQRMQARLQVLGGVGGIGRAVEEAAEQAVALLADRADALQHAVQRHAEQQQRVRREHQAAFEHFRHDFRRARRQQPVELVVVERAHDDRQLGPRLMRVMEDLQRHRRVRERDRRARAPSRARRRTARPCARRRRRRRCSLRPPPRAPAADPSRAR